MSLFKLSVQAWSNKLRKPVSAKTSTGQKNFKIKLMP